MIALLAMSLAVLMLGIDATSVNIALVSIQRDTGALLPELQWILNAYLLTIAGFMVTGGRMGDTFGRKRIFNIGVVIFSLSSALGGLAPSVGWIIASRVFQGIGGALLWPNTIAIAYGAVGPERRGSAIGTLTGVGGLAMAIGPLLGGYFVQEFSWRAIFWLNLPIGIMLMAATTWAIREKDTQHPESIDYLGSILFSLTLFVLIYSIQQASNWGLSCIILFGLFVFWQKRAKFPLIDFSLLKNKIFIVAVLARFLMSCTWIVVLFVMALYFQHVLGLSALQSGIIFLPLTLTYGAMSAVGGRIIDHLGFRKPILFGLLVAGVGFAILSRISMTDSHEFFLLPFLLMGLGQGLATPGMGTGALSTVSKEKTSVASGLFTMVSLAGGTISVGLVGLLLGYFGDARLLSKLHMMGIVPNHHEEHILKGFLTAQKTSNDILGAFPDSIRQAALQLSDIVYTDMLGIAMMICCIMSFLAFVLALASLKPSA